MNADDPKKRETTIMWELQVLKALDLPSAEWMHKTLGRMTTRDEDGYSTKTLNPAKIITESSLV